jgi:hypothetical protein
MLLIVRLSLKAMFQVAMGKSVACWANAEKIRPAIGEVPTPTGLPFSQSEQQYWFHCRGVQQRVGPQQRHRIGQQSHAPVKPQAVQKLEMYGSSRSSNWLVPATGRRFMPARLTLLNALGPPFVQDLTFPTDQTVSQ